MNPPDQSRAKAFSRRSPRKTNLLLWLIMGFMAFWLSWKYQAGSRISDQRDRHMKSEPANATAARDVVAPKPLGYERVGHADSSNEALHLDRFPSGDWPALADIPSAHHQTEVTLGRSGNAEDPGEVASSAEVTSSAAGPTQHRRP